MPENLITRAVGAGFAAALLLGAAACGDDDDDVNLEEPIEGEIEEELQEDE